MKKNIKKVWEYLKNHPLQSLLGLTAGGYLGYNLSKDDEEENLKKIENLIPKDKLEQIRQAQQQIQQTQQTQQKPTANTLDFNVKSQLLNTFNVIKSLEEERQKYINTMQNITSELNNEVNNYAEIVKELNNKTATISNAVITYLAKQGLGSYLDNDFVEHIQNTITYTPANLLQTALQKVVKGYLTTRALGVDTSGLSYIHLTELSDNPTYAKVLEPQFLAGVDVISKTLSNQYTNYVNQFKMRQEQKKIDLEVLNKTADILGSMINSNLAKANILNDYQKTLLNYAASIYSSNMHYAGVKYNADKDLEVVKMKLADNQDNTTQDALSQAEMILRGK